MSLNDRYLEIARQLKNHDERLDKLETIEGLGGWVLIEEIVGPVATFSFTSISSVYKHLRILGILRSDRATSNDPIRINFNGDYGNNYYYSRAAFFHNVGYVTAEGLGVPNIHGGYITGANSPAFWVSPYDLFIPCYSRTVVYKVAQIIEVTFADSPTGSIFLRYCAGIWLNTNSITRIDIATMAAGNFVAGSVLGLYGIR